jgi:hypothetical protein
MWKNLFSIATNFIGGSSVQIYIYLALLVAGFGGGFYLEHLRFQEFRLEVEAAGKAAEEHTKAVEQQHALINKEIANDYQTKLNAIRNFYSSGVRNPSSGTMSGISPAPKGTDAATAYPILAEQCTRTTLQLTELQDWINQQAGIK